MGDLDQTVDRLDAWFEGDPEALGRLLEENLGWMQLYVRRELDAGMRKRLDSVDVVQEGVARLLRRGPRYAPRCREEFRALLAKVLQGALGDQRDHARAVKRDVGRERPMPSAGLSRFVPQGKAQSRPESVLDRRDRKDRILSALAQLPTEDAEVIRLHQLEELPFAEVAERLELPSADAARMRFHRALPRLARILEASDPPDEV